MLYPKIEYCIEVVGDKYTVAVMAAKRVKDLAFKMPAEGALTYALTEIADGKIVPSINPS